MRCVTPAKDAPAPLDARRPERTDGRPAPELRATATAPVSASHDALGGSPLDPRLTFASFVIGRSNTLAHAAARQVAEGRRGDRVMFNPLYIHAGVGLGKTHLLQAVTWAGNSGSERKVLYLTAEKFMYGFVAALKTQTALAFKEALRGIDVLVIDDLQFLQGKSTQAEFCHTLNALIDAGRQVVIAADRPPSDLESLDDRVRSRLAGGLVVEMGSLGEELRLGILKSRVAAARAHHATFDVPAPVLDYLARTITHNGRDLEGAVNRLLAHSKLNAQPVTLEMAEREVRDLIRPQEPKRIKIEDIQRVVARQYNVSRSDLLSSRRTANVVRPRQVAMYLAKTLTLRSLPEIGRRFGGRDHTTVLHAVRKIEALVAKDVALVRRGRSRSSASCRSNARTGSSPPCGTGWPVAAAADRGAAGHFCRKRGERPRRFPCAGGHPRHLAVPPRVWSNPASIRLFGFQMPRRCLSGRPAFPSLGSGGYCNEGHGRTRATAEIAGPRPSRGRAPQHHSDPRQRAVPRRKRPAVAESHRPRPRGDRNAGGGNRDRRLDHRAGAHVLRHRAQTARRLADRAGRRRRPRGAGDPRRPLALHAADPAGKRFPGSRRRRHDAFVHAGRRRPEAADRPHAVRDLDRRDALLPQRHLSARAGTRQGRDPARGRDRRPSAGAGRSAVAEGRGRHAGRDRAAQDRRRSAAADRGQ